MRNHDIHITFPGEKIVQIEHTCFCTFSLAFQFCHSTANIKNCNREHKQYFKPPQLKLANFSFVLATSENPEEWQDIIPYEENKEHLLQLSNVVKGFRRLPAQN
jgi:hypothetical protein